ncbi:MAG: POT family MFS transporter [Myxococcaceae bacterium]
MASTSTFPPQVKFIIGNEAAERFSFYGMKNILTFYLVNYLLMNEVPDKALREGSASATYHLFVGAVYLFPLLGGLIADLLWGKYRTIMYLSLLYCLGHALLALFDDNKWGFYSGLGLIALGAGGIKPCVAAQVGDQFDPVTQRDLVKKVFALFYWSINFGSFFASLLIPWTLHRFGPAVAFGIPGVLMFVATVIFWAGRNLYVNRPPAGPNPHSFSKVLLNPKAHPPDKVEGAHSVLRILMIFVPIPLFWALFDQKGSTWILQAQQMDLQLGSVTFQPSQIMALNPLMVMLLVPFSEYVLYPLLERHGLVLSPLRRMTIGMFVACVAFVLVGALQLVLDSGTKISLLWQAAPCLVLTLAEVLVSVTGLEFAYSQAPAEMKSTIMACWNLTVTVGNFLVAVIARLALFDLAGNYFFFAALIFVAGLAFAWIARRYRAGDFFRKAPVTA